jgi:hypothetical protein
MPTTALLPAQGHCISTQPIEDKKSSETPDKKPMMPSAKSSSSNRRKSHRKMPTMSSSGQNGTLQQIKVPKCANDTVQSPMKVELPTVIGPIKMENGPSSSETCVTNGLA